MLIPVATLVLYLSETGDSYHACAFFSYGMCIPIPYTSCCIKESIIFHGNRLVFDVLNLVVTSVLYVYVAEVLIPLLPLVSPVFLGAHLVPVYSALCCDCKNINLLFTWEYV